MKKTQISAESENQKSHQPNKPTPAKTTRRRYSDFFDFAPVGYFTFNRDGLIQNVNPDGAVLLRTDTNNLLNQPLANFLSPDSKKDIRAAQSAAF